MVLTRSKSAGTPACPNTAVSTHRPTAQKQTSTKKMKSTGPTGSSTAQPPSHAASQNSVASHIPYLYHAYQIIFNSKFDVSIVTNFCKTVNPKLVTVGILFVVLLGACWKWTTFNIETVGHSRALRELHIKFSHNTYERTSEVRAIVDKLDQLRTQYPGTEIHTVISGGPGSGKSELARQVGQALYYRDNFYQIFGRRFDVSFAFYPTDVLTLDASSLIHLHCSIEGAIEKLKGKEIDVTLCIESQIQKDIVFFKFRQLKQSLKDRSSRPVIIFDNVQKQMYSFLYKKHSYSKFLLHPGNDQYGEIQIVVTTQNRPSARFQFVGYFSLFDGMPKDSGVDLLNAITNIQDDNKNARYLVEKLGGLPLSLVQAAFYIQLEVSFHGEYSYYSYLKEFELDLVEYRRNVEEMWQDCVDEGAPNRLTAVAASIKTIEQLIKTEDRYFFTNVACFVGYCDSHTISAKLLWDYIRTNPMLKEYTEFVANNLVRKSSIYELRLRNRSHSSFKDNLILTHQVTREASRAACNINSNVSANLTVEDYLARIVSVLFTGLTAEPNPAINQIVEYTSLNFKIVDVLMSLARNAHHQHMNFSKVVSKKFCWTFLGSMAEAYLYWPNKHKSTVIMPRVKFLVSMTGESFSTKRPELGALLSVLYFHYTGNENPDDLQTMTSLVENFARRPLQNSDKTSIDKTVLLLNMIGTVYRGIGQNMSKAQELHELALDIAKHYGSPEEIAVSLHLLGIIHRYQKHLATAALYHGEAVQLARNIYSDKNPRLGAFLLNYAVVLSRLDKLEEAYDMYNDALGIVKAAYGSRDQRVARILNTMAVNCNSLGKYKESVAVFTEALSIHEEIHGDVHPNVAETLYFLGFTLRVVGELQRSLEALQRSLEIRQQYYGSYHYQVAEVLHDLSNTQRELHDFDAALANANRCLEIFRNILGENSSEVAVSLNGIGLIYLELEDAVTAKVNHEKALGIFEKLSSEGSQTRSISETLKNIGLAYMKLGQPREAKEYYIKSLDMIKPVFNEGHPRLLEIIKLLDGLEQLRKEQL